jgi:O-antigen ligase
MLLISIAAVGTVNVYRFFEIALRRPPFPASVVDVHRWVRISATFPDVNAAGAFFLLVAPVALSALTDRRYRGVGAVAILPVLAGLWLSGSRTALIAFALTLTLMAGLAPDRTRRWRLGFIGAILILCLLITVFNPRAKTAGDSVIAFGVRREMAAATLRVLQEHPLTGVGIGQFQPRSPQYMSPLMKSWYPSENAHNQFLQAAAETGLPGFAAFAVLVALGAMPAALVVARSRDPLERGTAFGVLAFLATFLTNHPLLMPEVAVAFWIVLGTCRARRLRGAMA